MKIKMVRCPNCGGFVEDTATTCVFCKDRIGAITTKRVRVEYDKVPRSGRYEQPAIGVYDPVRVMFIPRVTRIEILNPNKVLRFTFHDGSQIKTVCAKDDTFDPELACYIAYAKMLNKKCFRNAYNAEGIVHLANDLRYEKCYEKLVAKALKIYVKELTEYNSAHMVQIDGKSPRDIMDKFLNALTKSGV